DLINVSLKYFKDNYKTIMKDLENKQLERYQIAPEPKEVIKESEEEKVIDLIPKRKKEDLVDIISAIEDISGEKYEWSISGDDDDEYDEEDDEEIESEDSELIGELPEDLNSLTVKELKRYCKKNDINLPTKARKADIIKIIKYVLDNE
ncbi:MAG: hypothetical protein ACFE8G_09305, partial [Candidatus Hermodarchaeota archaeon]